MTLDRKLLTRVVGATDANRLDVDASGRALVSINADTVGLAKESGGNLATLAGVVASARAAVNPIVGQSGVQGGAGGSTATTQRVAIATDANSISGTVTANAGTNLNTSALALEATQAAVKTAVELIDNASVAHGATAVAGVTQVGFEARGTMPAPVADGQAVRPKATLLGKIVNYPLAIPASTWSYAAASGGIVNTTGVSVKGAAGSGIRNYVSRVQVINGHASVSTDVQIRDGASGTVLWRGWAQKEGGGVSAIFDPPLRGTANTLIEIACGTTGAAVYFNLQGFVASE